MASGQNVLARAIIFPPATAFAELQVIAGGSTPAERYPAYFFDDTAIEYIDLICRMGENYGGGGVAVTWPIKPATATTGNMIVRAAFRRLDASEDIDTAHTYDFNTPSAIAAPGTLGLLASATVTFTNGADMDSVVAGDRFVLRVGREGSSGSDTMSGDAGFLLDLLKVVES